MRLKDKIELGVEAPGGNEQAIEHFIMLPFTIGFAIKFSFYI